MRTERIVIPRTGGPEVLSIESFQSRPPQDGEIAIDVRAIGINFADVFCRLGMYKAAPSRPFAPGFEVAGVVAQTSGNSCGFSEGDRVFAITRFGGYATRLNVQSTWVRRLPENWSFEDGAAFPVVYLTAYHGLKNVGQMAAGETVVVHSAAGGVGTAACQIASAQGARVIGTVGSQAKREAALGAGAHEVVVSSRYAVWDAIDRLSGGTGVDLILDAVGGSGLRHGFEALRPGGRLIIYGFSEMMPKGGRRNWPLLIWRYLRTPRPNPLKMTESNRTVAGFNLVYLWDRPQLFGDTIKDLLAMSGRGEINPVVGKTFPFHRVADAHAFLQSRRSTGKVILVCE